MVNVEIERCQKDDKGQIKKDKKGNDLGIVLDLTNDPDFQLGGQYINPIGGMLYCDNNSIGNAMVDRLKTKFFHDANNATRYRGYFPIFVFGNIRFDARMSGRVRAIGVKNVMLCGLRSDSTLPHEALHGLGLLHTHFNSPIIAECDRKYVFKRNTTDNIMKYNVYGADDRRNTWHWQWLIIRSKI